MKDEKEYCDWVIYQLFTYLNYEETPASVFVRAFEETKGCDKLEMIELIAEMRVKWPFIEIKVISIDHWRPTDWDSMITEVKLFFPDVEVYAYYD